MFPGISTQTRLSQGAHIFSDAVSMLGSVASIVVHRSSQTEKQLRRLHTLLGQLTRYSSVDDRNSMFIYGESRFWGKPAYVHLDPGVERIIDGYVNRAKAA